MNGKKKGRKIRFKRCGASDENPESDGERIYSRFGT